MDMSDRNFEREAARMRSDRPRRRRRDRDEDEDDGPPEKTGGGSLPLILLLCGGGALLLILLACGSCLFFIPFKFTPSQPPEPPVAVIDPPPPQPVGNLGGPVNPPPEVPNPNPPQVPPRRPRGGPPNDPPAPPPPPPLVPWQVKADPLPAGLTLADNPQGSIPITGYPPAPNNLVDQVVFPTSPSPFVSVAVKGRINDAHEVWDLRTMKRVGVAVDPEHPFSQAVLSPDGAFWAKPIFQLGTAGGADVYDVADGRLYTRVVSDKNHWFQHLDFAGPGQVVTFLDVAGKGQIDLLVQIWDIKTRESLCQIIAQAFIDEKQRAFSPGRRYIALNHRDNNRVLLYELSRGVLSGELQVAAGSVCQGLSFAADGNSLAGLFKSGATTRLLTWDLATGKLTADHKFDKAPVENVGAIRGPAIEWLPRGTGWLLFGQALVDKQSGAVYWRIPVEGADGTHPRHIFGDGVLAYVKNDQAGPPKEGKPGRGRGARGTKTLVFEPLPADEVAAALNAARAGR
jgi:hypothetical protein